MALRADRCGACRGVGGVRDTKCRRRRWSAILKAWQGDAVDTLRIWHATASLPHLSASLYVMLHVRWFGGREREGGGQGCSRVARAFETASHARVSVVRVTCCTGCRWRRSCGI